MDNIIFVLTGPSGAGKTTYAKLLKNKIGEDKVGSSVVYTTQNQNLKN